ncbi:MAG TPA: TetR family transcriptional regulator [Actinomycetota bacterium]|nr:TetR family transcriptional regulator [Actinomycetota bacterium]
MATVLDAPADTRTRILDAAFRSVERFGLSRFTVDDVAKAAGLSRQTVYRYFDSKDDLVMALVLREEEAFIDGVRAEFETHGDFEAAMTAAIRYCLVSARAHPLLDRLLAAEPDVLLPYLTVRGMPLVTRARTALEDLVGGRIDADRDLVRRAADLAVRAVISYTLTPTDDRPEDVARGTAKLLTAALRGTRKEKR